MISATTSATAPAAPGRLGKPLAPEDALGYLAALGTWRDERKAELDVLDQAALDASDGAAFTGDLMLSMALWKAVADRRDLLVATWDSGRVGTTELERLSTLIWGRLDAARGAVVASSRPQTRVERRASSVVPTRPESQVATRRSRRSATAFQSAIESSRSPVYAAASTAPSATSSSTSSSALRSSRQVPRASR